MLKISRMTARVLRYGVLPVVVLLAESCTKEESPGTDGTLLAVTFTAGIEQAAMPATTAAGVPQTRTTNGGDSWTPNDAIGIFMLTLGGTLPDDVVSATDNVRYTVTDASTGALSGGPVYYPQSGNVDFVAYYPHGTASTGAAAGTVNTTDYTYNISVADQSNPAAIDVLYAKAAGKSRTTEPVSLSFGHVMSKITLNVTHGEGVTADNISGMAASDVAFNAMPTTATMALQDGRLTAGASSTRPFSPLKAATAPTSCDATFTAILVPQPIGHGLTGRTVVFTLAGIGNLTWDIPDNEPFEAGKHYTYPITIRKKGVTVGAPGIIRWNLNDHGVEF